MLSVCAMTSVWPSGCARAVASSAVAAPPAPGLFSTTMFQPVSSAMALPIARVSVSCRRAGTAR